MDNDKNTVLGWLGMDQTFNFTKSRLLGSFVGFILIFFALTAAITVFVILGQVAWAVFSPTPEGVLKDVQLRNYTLILAAFIGAPFVVWRAVILQKQTNIAEQGLITDRFTKAVEQLGKERTVRFHRRNSHKILLYESKTGEKDSELDYKKPIFSEETQPNIEVRLGGLYALERIAQDSERDHITIMEVLCAYIRENASEPRIDEVATKADTSNTKHYLHPRVDIQAALTILGRREKQNPGRMELEKANAYRLDLRNCHLAHADLNGAELGPVQIGNSNLQEAQLYGANLQGAWLGRANLQKTDFTHAHTRLAWVKSTLMGQVLGLTDQQVTSMLGDGSTQLPKDMPRPDHWPLEDLDFKDFFTHWHNAKSKAGLT